MSVRETELFFSLQWFNREVKLNSSFSLGHETDSKHEMSLTAKIKKQNIKAHLQIHLAAAAVVAVVVVAVAAVVVAAAAVVVVVVVAAVVFVVVAVVVVAAAAVVFVVVAVVVPDLEQVGNVRTQT